MTTEQTDALSAGQLLSQTRERKQLSIYQVAVQLNLKPDLIVKIEQDALDTAILATFARGYLRAYARLLRLSEKQVIEAFERQTGMQGSTAKPMRTFSNRTAEQATENRFMWLTYAIGILLIVLLFIWWWQTAQQSSAETPAPLETIITDTQPQTAATEQTPPAAFDDTDMTTAQLALVPEFQILTDLLPEAADEFAASQPAELITPVVDTLKMTFRDDCWIDVVDADENRIAYGTKQAGYVMEVSGRAPFVITLGSPNVVDIEFNRQPYDTSALPVNRVAKFTLPRSGQ
ncbi:DUF4115 domain-containing protein [Chromatiaceae bacterium AAb-1]|nr:DUF4115 domain-containing protein [Chromatiaceae bacterium AAb-1]